jgi:hypothetical protein
VSGRVAARFLIRWVLGSVVYEGLLSGPGLWDIVIGIGSWARQKKTQSTKKVQTRNRRGGPEELSSPPDPIGEIWTDQGLRAETDFGLRGELKVSQFHPKGNLSFSLSLSPSAIPSPGVDHSPPLLLLFLRPELHVTRDASKAGGPHKVNKQPSTLDSVRERQVQTTE